VDLAPGHLGLGPQPVHLLPGGLRLLGEAGLQSLELRGGQSTGLTHGVAKGETQSALTGSSLIQNTRLDVLCVGTVSSAKFNLAYSQPFMLRDLASNVIYNVVTLMNK
jgi:hypothetical protein